MNAQFLSWLPMDAGDSVKAAVTYHDYVLVFTARGRILKLTPGEEDE